MAGQALGHMVDIWGDVIETTTCTFERGWIGSIRRPLMPIYSGDQIIELVETVIPWRPMLRREYASGRADGAADRVLIGVE